MATAQSGTVKDAGTVRRTGAGAANAALPTRDRLLQAAAELFYADGIVAVGVDRICQRAQVSKRSLYQLFGTKDELVAASLDRFGTWLIGQYIPPQDADLSPRDRILSVFGWLEQATTSQTYAGCPFVSAATELKDATHPGSVVARAMKAQLTGFFEQQAVAGGASDPALLAQQLTVVFDGSGDRVVVAGHPLDGLALSMATLMLDAAGVH